LTIGPYAGCGSYDFAGVAELVGLDTGTRVQAPYAISTTVPCTEGCTRGVGYWKTHSGHGPAPYDATWERLAAGADTPLLASPFTYFEALLTRARTDPWLRLSRQWVAAQLNQYAGADPTAVAAAFAEAGELLRATAAGSTSGAPAQRMSELAELLEAWNEGKIGPGSCDDRR